MHGEERVRKGGECGCLLIEEQCSFTRWLYRPSTSFLREGHSGSHEKQRDPQSLAGAAESTWWPVGDMEEVTTETLGNVKTGSSKAVISGRD